MDEERNYKSRDENTPDEGGSQLIGRRLTGKEVLQRRIEELEHLTAGLRALHEALPENLRGLSGAADEALYNLVAQYGLGRGF